MNPNILAIETATNTCSVAVAGGSSLLAAVDIYRPRSHAEFLADAIKQVLAFADVPLADVEIIAVSAGPGSYTGLRIGASMAKGLAFGTDAKLVAVSTLEALALQAAAQAGEGDVIVPLLNSRQNEFYAAAFERGAEGILKTLIPPEAISAENLPRHAEFERRIWIVGEGADRAAAAIEHQDDIIFLPELAASATTVAELAASRAGNGQYEDVAEFEPRYLKEFVARRPASIFNRLGQKLKKDSTPS